MRGDGNGRPVLRKKGRCGGRKKWKKGFVCARRGNHVTPPVVYCTSRRDLSFGSGKYSWLGALLGLLPSVLLRP